MRNYEHYFKLMSANITEKADFIVQELATGSYNTVIDFGCANGALTRELAKAFPQINFIGYDINADIIHINNKTNEFTNITYTTELPTLGMTSKVLTIFSSVLHELFTFNATVEAFKLMSDSKAFAIRDMYFTQPRNGGLELQDNMLGYFGKEMRQKYFEVHGLTDFENDKQKADFLMKTPYVSNYHLEVQENYFATDFNFIDVLANSCGKTQIFKHKYFNSFLKQKLPNLSLFTKTTHIKLIYKKL